MRGWIGCTVGVISLLMLLAASESVAADGGNRPDIVPELSLSYVDGNSGERRECSGDCRRFAVPAGIQLEVRVTIRDEGGSDAGDRATWDLWINQPNHPFPGFNLESCYDAKVGRLDRGCWQAMHERVDHEAWDNLVPDVVCVPSAEGASCRDRTVRVVMDPDFDGARRTGVYHFAVWANRFATVPEWDEFDDYAGPIRVTVDPPEAGDDNATVASEEPVIEVSREDQPTGFSPARSPIMLRPPSPMPYGVAVVPEEMEYSFTVTSMRSQRLLEFAPACAGEVEVEVSQTGMYENMIVQVRKVSTGEILAEARGKGRLMLTGEVDDFLLKDDRTFELVVIPGQGSRGIRGTMRVSYPARLRYMVAP